MSIDVHTSAARVSAGFGSSPSGYVLSGHAVVLDPSQGCEEAYPHKSMLRAAQPPRQRARTTDVVPAVCAPDMNDPGLLPGRPGATPR